MDGSKRARAAISFDGTSLRASDGRYSFRRLLLSAGLETWVSEQPSQGWPLLKIRQSVTVFEAVLGILNGAFTIAEIVIGFGDIGEHPCVPWGKREGGMRVGQGLFAKLVFRIKQAEHGLYGSLLGIQ